MGIEIVCTPGYDGGLPQVFILEMFSSISGLVRFVETCNFKIRNLLNWQLLQVQSDKHRRAEIFIGEFGHINDSNDKREQFFESEGVFYKSERP